MEGEPFPSSEQRNGNDSLPTVLHKITAPKLSMRYSCRGNRNALHFVEYNTKDTLIVYAHVPRFVFAFN